MRKNLGQAGARTSALLVRRRKGEAHLKLVLEAKARQQSTDGSKQMPQEKRPSPPGGPKTEKKQNTADGGGRRYATRSSASRDPSISDHSKNKPPFLRNAMIRAISSFRSFEDELCEMDLGEQQATKANRWKRAPVKPINASTDSIGALFLPLRLSRRA